MSTVAAIIPPSTTIADAQNIAAGSTRAPVRTLGQDDFLKLVVAQLTSQDPLNPQKDTEFIAQMAQFSSLEQAKAMQGDMAKLRNDQQFLQANGLIGRAVELQSSTDSSITTGLVTGVVVEAGMPLIVVNGQGHDLSELLAIAPAPTPTP